MKYTCCEENRRASIESHPTLNGIDWLEVLDTDAPTDSPRQQTLMLRLLKPVPAGLSLDNVRISGGERVRDPSVVWVGIASSPPAQASAAEQAYFTALDDADRVLLIRTRTSGDFSTYCLQLLQGAADDSPLPSFDPRLSSVHFEFKVECASDFDCAPVEDCDKPVEPTPEIDYLARDFSSLRRLVMDRFSKQMPAWQDRSPADLATTLGELIAYVGDLQHYELDSISTEAYLHTARRRTSLRRHALLVDYRMHEGCNARVWLHLETSGAAFPLPVGLKFYTRVPGVPANVSPDTPDARNLLLGNPVVFEPMHEITLRSEHNQFEFYTWGDSRCCLPKGATAATLRGHWPDLEPGNVLIIQEVLGPLSGNAEDANPANRHAVRLSAVRAFAGTEPLVDPLDDTEITEIKWQVDDALPLPICVSAETDAAHGGALVENISIVLGNVVLADHGASIEDEYLGDVPRPLLHYPANAGKHCDPVQSEPIPPRFRPLLDRGPLTHQGSVVRTVLEDGMRRSERVLFDAGASATAAMDWETAQAIPSILLSDGEDNWSPRRELLSSRASDRHFVVEIEEDGSTRLRFGDDTNGRRPDSGMEFHASYRIGNGVEGNVGANTIAHIRTNESRLLAVTNPLPGAGGKPRETNAEVRRHAPHAFRKQERAVTPEDYAAVTERLAGVQRAAAGMRWTGSWHTVFATVDRDAGEPVDSEFAATVVEHLDRYRMAGHDLKVNNPIHVSLEIEMLVCVKADYFRSNVRQGLLDAFSSGLRADGEPGLFHPDNFSFGQTVFLSPLYAAARAVAGVDSIQVIRFERQGQEDPKPLQVGFMTLDRLEIARLDNDRNFPERGVLKLELYGGK